MTDEPYRWLEAVANRREYIRDQLKQATPVFAFSRPEGVLLYGVGSGQSKVFEIYDRQGIAALGHPVDIEKVRQSLIEAAHLEGFTRSAEDVTLRRLINFSIGPLMKTNFEQIFGAPLIVIALLAEVGLTAAQDVIAHVTFDGTHQLISGGIAVAHADAEREKEAVQWLSNEVKGELSLKDVIARARQAWEKFGGVDGGLAGRTEEVALLERRGTSRARYRAIDPQTLP
jgi:proteasome alpha subunit